MTGFEVLQPGSGPIRGSAYLPSTPDHVLWGRLPCATDDAVLTVEPGTEVTFDTVSHEGILEDQGRDPKAFFGRYDVVGVLDDAIEIAASEVSHTFGVDGPHVVDVRAQVSDREAELCRLLHGVDVHGLALDAALGRAEYVRFGTADAQVA